MKTPMTVRKPVCSLFAMLALIGSVHGAGKPVRKPVKPTSKAKPSVQKIVTPAAKPALSSLVATDDFRWGYIDKTGKVAFSGFDEVGDFSDGLAPVKTNWRYGFVDTTGKMVVPANYLCVGAFSDGLAPVKAGKLWGYVDHAGNMVIHPQYDEAWSFGEGTAVVRTGDRFGAIDKTGAIIIQPSYDKLGTMSEGLIAACQGGKWGYIDKAATVAIPLQFDRAGDFSGGLATAWSGGKCGFIDKSGKWVVEAKYDDAQSFSEGLAAVAVKKRDVVKNAEGRVVSMKTFLIWGYVDTTGNEVIPQSLLNVVPFSEGLAPVWKDGTFGYVDKTGVMQLVPVYNKKTGSFHDGLAKTEIGVRSGYVDDTGKMVIPQQYAGADAFSEGLAAVQILPGGPVGYIDTSGKVVIKPQFQSGSGFHKGYAAVQLDWNLGIIDKTGKVVLKPQFDEIAWYNDKIVAAKDEKLWGFFDWSGNPTLKPQFESISCLGDSKIIVRKGNKYGIVDATGKLVVPTQYDDCGWLFAEGLLPVDVGGKFGFIDETGKSVIEPQYDAVGGFTPEGLCSVKLGDKWGFIDRTNKTAIAPQFDLATCFSEGIAAVKVGDKWGYIDKTGNFLVKPQFDDALAFSNGLAPVMTGEKWGYVDKTGKLVIPAKFDRPGGFRNGIAQIRIGKQTGYINTTGKAVWMSRLYQDAVQAKPDQSLVTISDGVRILRVKVVGDQILQKKSSWSANLEKRMQAVSALLEKNVKVRLTITKIDPWQSPDFKDGEDPKSYQSSINAVLTTDVPVDDAELVIGFTGRASGSKTLAFTHHYQNRVIIFDPYEGAPSLEKQMVETVAHEICHTFGAFHVGDKYSIMYPTTADCDQSSFDQYTSRQFSLMLDYDFGRGIYGIPEDKARQAAAIFAEGHVPNEVCPVAKGHVGLADTLRWRGDIAGAIDEYRKALELEGTEPDRSDICRIGEVLIDDGQLIPGIAMLRKSGGLESRKEISAFWHGVLAKDLKERLDADSGFAAYQQATKPQLAEIYERYIRARVNLEEITNEYRKAIDDDPKDASYHYGLGTVLLAFGHNDEALAEYQQAVTLAPDDFWYKSELGALKIQMGVQ